MRMCVVHCGLSGLLVVWIRMEDLKKVLPEGLPKGMVQEFEESMRPALLVRQSFLDLRDNFRRIVDPPLPTAKSKGADFLFAAVAYMDIVYYAMEVWEVESWIQF